VDVWGAIRVLVRRFYITVPLAAITLLLAFMFTHRIAPEYHATGSFVLMGPTAQPAPKNVPPPPINPYAQMGTNTVATTLQIDVNTNATKTAIMDAGNTNDYTVGGVGKTAILQVTATSKNAHQALSTVAQVMTMMRNDLVNRQSRYTKDPTQQITAQVIASPQLQSPDSTTKIRAEVIAMGAAVILTIILVLVIDSMMVSGERRHRIEDQGSQLSLEDATRARTSVVRS
jgi:hypothetical protein